MDSDLDIYIYVDKSILNPKVVDSEFGYMDSESDLDVLNHKVVFKLQNQNTI